MKIEAIKNKLTDALNHAERVTGRNMSLPVLGCVLLYADSGNLKISATNLDLGIEISLPVRVVEKGALAVPGKVLSSFISHLTGDGGVVLETLNNNLKVSTKHITTTIKSLPHEDFPTIPNVSSENSLKINTKDFIDGLKSVWYSASLSSIKPELSSIYIYSDDSNNLVFVATDSFRLAEKKVKTKKTKQLGQILIPFKNVGEIVKIFEGVGGEIEVRIDKNQIAFLYGEMHLTSRIIDGVFPDYKQIIPKEFKTSVVVLKQDLANALKLANIFSDKLNQINIKAAPSKRIFELNTKNADVGENNNKLDAVFEGEDISINFNYKYIADCFQSINSDSVTLGFNGLSRPVVIKGVSDKSFLYLVMPMNK